MRGRPGQRLAVVGVAILVLAMVAWLPRLDPGGLVVEAKAGVGDGERSGPVAVPYRPVLFAWTSVTNPTTSNLNAVFCPTATICYAVGDNGVAVKSVAAGLTWATTAGSTGTTQQLLGLYCTDASTCIAVGTSGPPFGAGTIVRTTNGGTTWAPASTNPTSNSIDRVTCPTSTTCYAVGFGAISIVSTDAGDNWSATPTAPAPLNLGNVRCLDVNTCLVSDLAGAIWRTTNGGTSWTNVRAASSQNIFGLDCAPGGTPTTSLCVAGGNGGNLITRSTDGGAVVDGRGRRRAGRRSESGDPLPDDDALLPWRRRPAPVHLSL